MAEKFLNDFITTLNGAISNSDTTIVVDDAAVESADFVVLIDDELVRVTAGGTGTSWTVTRGYDGTTAVSHADGSAVVSVVSAQQLDNVIAGESFSFETGHTEWADGLSNEEIHRIVAQTGETVVIDRVEFQQKGGGSSVSASVRVQDLTAASTIVSSVDLGSVDNAGGSSGVANTVAVQITNSTGGAIDATVRVVGRITT